MRSQIAIVTQDTILFNDTVANNIIYGQPDCSKEHVCRRRAANAHEFVSQLTDGYDTLIGERRQTLRRSETASLDCPCPGQGLSHPHP